MRINISRKKKEMTIIQREEGQTHAVLNRTEMMNPNSVVSTSVGSSPPRNQNGRRVLESAARDDDRTLTRTPLMVSQISRFDDRISSSVRRSVPCPYNMALWLRYTIWPTRTRMGHGIDDSAWSRMM